MYIGMYQSYERVPCLFLVLITRKCTKELYQLLCLLYIQLTISFLIGRKRTVNFRNQRLGRHLAADYTTIMSRTFKVTGNHVMYDRGA